MWERRPMTSQSNGCTAAAVTKTHQSSRPGSMLPDGGGSPACVPCAAWVVAPSPSPPSTPPGCIIFGGRNREEYPRGRVIGRPVCFADRMDALHVGHRADSGIRGDGQPAGQRRQWPEALHLPLQVPGFGCSLRLHVLHVTRPDPTCCL